MTETKAKIMIVDDDTYITDMYALKFKNAGYSVSVYNSSEKALEALRNSEETPDVILIDIIMPGIDGKELVKKIREEGLAANSKIVILSNQSEQEYLDELKEYNIATGIVKANHLPSEVVSIIESVLFK